MLDNFLEGKLAHRKRAIFLSAILCGVAMGLVALFSTVLSAMSSNVILSKALYAFSFSGLLFLTVANGYELFTGNTMLLTLVHKKDKRRGVFTNLALVYSGNLLGCLLMALALWAAGIHKSLGLEAALAKTFEAKTNLGIFKMLLLGIMANYLVCMGVFLAVKGNKDFVNQFMGLFFPISIFCLLGFEHSVANMFTLSYAALCTKSGILKALLNLFFVTIGNVVGGVLFALSTKVKNPPKEKSL